MKYISYFEHIRLSYSFCLSYMFKIYIRVNVKKKKLLFFLILKLLNIYDKKKYHCLYDPKKNKKYKYLSFVIAQSEEIETLNLLTQMKD